VLRITPNTFSKAGSFFSDTPIALQNNASFSTEFAFRMSNPAGIGDADGAGADGIMFVVQTVANNVGGAGGGIGYLGIPHSLGVEFDTFNNGGVDNDNNHVAVNFNGVLTDTSRTTVTPPFQHGDLWHAWVDYNGQNQDLQVRLSMTDSRPSSALIDMTVNLESILGQSSAFVGFTAGTGAGAENHDIISWAFNNNFEPIGGGGGGVPEVTSTFSLLGLAAAGLLALRRRLAIG
jgi:hypothetical protein